MTNTTFWIFFKLKSFLVIKAKVTILKSFWSKSVIIFLIWRIFSDSIFLAWICSWGFTLIKNFGSGIDQLGSLISKFASKSQGEFIARFFSFKLAVNPKTKTTMAAIMLWLESVRARLCQVDFHYFYLLLLTFVCVRFPLCWRWKKIFFLHFFHSLLPATCTCRSCWW